MTQEKRVRVAILDMNKGTKNLGIPSILGILEEVRNEWRLPRLEHQVFDVRIKEEVPGLEFDIYISSGGPGSPFAGRGKTWEAAYFRWLGDLWSFNQTAEREKPGLFICHSFEMMCHFFGLARVARRQSPSFGIYPVHMEDAGLTDVLFEHLENPFWGADFRRWQVIDPDMKRMRELDASVLAREKVRPHVPLERAVMALRVGSSLWGVQFHPEAAPEGMHRHFKRREKRALVVEEHGLEKYETMLGLIRHPSPLEATRRLVIPNFLKHALNLQFQASAAIS